MENTKIRRRSMRVGRKTGDKIAIPQENVYFIKNVQKVGQTVIIML